MLSPGVLLGNRYRLDDRIAGGGMGDVWRGTDEVLGRTVAIKVLLPALLEEHGFAERFRGEARTMATINHPGVVDIYDYGGDQSVMYLVMEYVEGDALSRTLGRVGRLTPARTMALVAQAADALQAAHDKGIVHRDVKPGNLLVRANGTLVLTDFGIARSAMVGQLTAAGSVLGTASYLSPEQASGSTASAASDIYSLGVVAYQCLAGHRPFEGENPLEIALKHVREAPRALPADTPPIVRSIVERAMAKDPAARWPSAATLAAVARQAAGTLGASVAGHATGPAGTPISVSPVPVSPTPGGPVSPGPGRPMSPGPVPRSPGPVPVSPVPVVAGPTQVLPPGGGIPRQPGGVPRQPAPAGFQRGAAAVPRPPERTSYAYGGHQPRPPARQQRRNGGLVLLAIVAAVLAVLLCAGVIGYVVRQAKNKAGGDGTPSPGPAGIVALDCAELKQKPARQARVAIERQGLRVKITAKAGGRTDVVADISPCRVPRGGEVTLTVRTGQGGGAATCGPGAPIVGCNPGDND